MSEEGKNCDQNSLKEPYSDPKSEICKEDDEEVYSTTIKTNEKWNSVPVNILKSEETKLHNSANIRNINNNSNKKVYQLKSDDDLLSSIFLSSPPCLSSPPLRIHQNKSKQKQPHSQPNLNHNKNSNLGKRFLTSSLAWLKSVMTNNNSNSSSIPSASSQPLKTLKIDDSIIKKLNLQSLLNGNSNDNNLGMPIKNALAAKSPTIAITRSSPPLSSSRGLPPVMIDQDAIKRATNISTLGNSSTSLKRPSLPNTNVDTTACSNISSINIEGNTPANPEEEHMMMMVMMRENRLILGVDNDDVGKDPHNTQMKRKRGRPRKYPPPTSSIEKEDEPPKSESLSPKSDILPLCIRDTEEDERTVPKKEDDIKTKVPVMIRKKKKTSAFSSYMLIDNIHEAGAELLRACELGHIGTVRALLKSNSSLILNFQDKLSKSSPLHGAIAHEQLDIVQALLTNCPLAANLDLRNVHGQNCVDFSIDNEYENDIISSLLQEEISFRKQMHITTNHTTINRMSLNEPRKWQKYLRETLPVDQIAYWTAYVAAKYDWPELNDEIVKTQLFSYRYSPNQGTLLHVACRFDSPRMVQWLLFNQTYNLHDALTKQDWVLQLDANKKLASEYVMVSRHPELRKLFRKYARLHDLQEDSRIFLDNNRYIITSDSDDDDDDDDDDINLNNNPQDRPSMSNPSQNKKLPSPRLTNDKSITTTMTSSSRMSSREERKLQQLLGILERAEEKSSVPSQMTEPSSRVKRRQEKNFRNEQSIPKKKRGRPRKHPVKKEEQANIKEEEENEERELQKLLSTIPIDDPEDGIFRPYYETKRKPTKRSQKSINSDKKKRTSTITKKHSTKKQTSHTTTSNGLIVLQDKATRRTLLHKAASRNNVERASELISLTNSLVNDQDNAGYTPLHEASLKGHVSMVQLLLQHGALCNVQALNGDTPLHDASENGHLLVVKLLIQHKANPLALNVNLQTPVDVGTMEVVKYFWNEHNLRPNPKFVKSTPKESEEEDEVDVKEVEDDKENVFQGKFISQHFPTIINDADRDLKEGKSSMGLVVVEELVVEPQLRKKRLPSSSTPFPLLFQKENFESNCHNSSVVDKLYLVQYQEKWHFLWDQVQAFCQQVTDGNRISTNSCSDGLIVVIGQDCNKILTSIDKDNSNVNSSSNSCQGRPLSSSSPSPPINTSLTLLEKERGYMLFRQQGIPLGSIPIIYLETSTILPHHKVDGDNENVRDHNDVDVDDKKNGNDSSRRNNDRLDEKKKLGGILPPKMRFKKQLANAS